jgi:hypothetical protein
MKNQFVTYQYPLKEVLPSVSQAADYLHLYDVQHPAYSFMLQKLDELKNTNLQAVGGYRIFNVEKLKIQEGQIQVGDVSMYMDRQVCGYMREASSVALFLCTAGSIFSTQYREYSKDCDYLEAFITDSIGSLTVENAMDNIQRELQASAKEAGQGISNRYSPGYCNWPLTGQQELFRLIGENSTGITLSDSCLMYPTKSVSGIIGIGTRMKRREYGCAICNNKNCIYRRIVQRNKS